MYPKRRFDHQTLLTLAGMAAFAAGCGGGQGRGAVTTGASHTSSAGQAVFSYFGQPKPLFTTSSGQVSVLGQAGATYNSITLQPAANLNSTYIVQGRFVNGETAFYKIPWSTATPQILYQNGFTGNGPSVSAYGTVAFNMFGLMSTIKEDGTGYQQLSYSNAANGLTPVYSVDGSNRIAFANGTSLEIGPGTGGSATVVQTNFVGNSIAWNPTGTLIAYSGSVGTTGNQDVFVTSTSGGTPTDIMPNTLQNVGLLNGITWSPDGTNITASFVGGSYSTYQLIKLHYGNVHYYEDLSPTGDDDFTPSYSPDGTKIAFYRLGDAGATPGIYTCDAAGANQQLWAADTAGQPNTGYDGLSWSPFLPKETVVASSGSTFYHQSSSGFLLSQVNDQVGSFVAFTATSPSSAAIQAPSATTGSQPLLFTITADAITQIGYINNYFSSGVTETLTSTPTVVVSIDANTGQVDLVAPAATKAVSAKNADGTFTYNAKFTAIYDGTGKSLAPGGAKQLTVNPRTGALVSFH